MDEKEQAEKILLENEKIRALEVLALKEELLSNIIVWLKAKDLWEDVKKDIPLLQRIK